MADGLNRVIACGNLGQDPELRQTSGGQAVLSLRMACSETYLDRNKVRQERTEWVSVTVWGKRGEGLSRILKKGDRILIEGSLRTSSYEKDGQKRYKTEVVASNVVLCGGGRGQSGGPPSESAGDAYEPGGAGGSAAPPDDEIPFVMVSGEREEWWP